MEKEIFMSSHNEVRGRRLMAYCLTRSVVIKTKRFSLFSEDSDI